MFSEMKTVERNQARRMRRDEGRSIKEIARLLGVSTSSVSHWVRDVELTDAQHSALQARVRLTCNLFADHEARQQEIENFWLRTLGLPRSCLCKSTVNHYSRYSQKKRRNKLPYGTCRIVVHSTEIAQTIYGSIQELAGFDRPEWLDMRP
jgi:predicted transcriptional regulator